MKSVEKFPSRFWLALPMLFAAVPTVIVGISLTLFSACAPTVRPTLVHSSTASWDGDVQNSGLIGLDEKNNAILTPHAKDRYNALMKIYGGKFVPPVEPGDGLLATPTNTFLLDSQHLVYFTIANRWRKQGN